MEANKILEADILDIIFDGRNKEYGAYNLRKSYVRRLVTAMGVMMATISLLVAGYVVAGKGKTPDKELLTLHDPHLTDFVVAPEIKHPQLPPPPKPALPKIQTVQFTTPPRIVPDKEVKADEMPPEIDKLADTKIDLLNREGMKDEGVTAPPLEDRGKGILDAPKKEEKDDEKIFIGVEVESQYPGGPGAWVRYLNKTFKYPEEAASTEKQGTVIVQFIVDQAGNVSDVEAISGPATGGLKEEAVRVIKKSGKWEPAIQNGRKVKSYKRQPIIFKLDVE